MVYCRHIGRIGVSFSLLCPHSGTLSIINTLAWWNVWLASSVSRGPLPLLLPLLPLSLRTCACAIWGASRTYWYMSVIKALLLLLLLVVNQNWFTLQSQSIMKFLMDLTLPKNKKIWGNLRLKCVLWDYKNEAYVCALIEL